MPKPDPYENPDPAWLGAVLIWIAGYVDAIGYITLFHIYAANMSGNSVSLAINFAERHGREAFGHACPVLAFFPGLIAGAAIVQGCKNAGLRSVFMPAMWLEAALLLMFILTAKHFGFTPQPSKPDYSSGFVLAVGMLSFCMGMQNGSQREIGGLKDIHTYVTGTLLAAADNTTQFLFWIGHQLRSRSPRRRRRVARFWYRQRSLRVAVYSFLLWVFYVIGAVLGTLALFHFGLLAMLAAVIALGIAGLVDLISPIGRHAPRSSDSSR